MVTSTCHQFWQSTPTYHKPFMVTSIQHQFHNEGYIMMTSIQIKADTWNGHHKPFMVKFTLTDRQHFMVTQTGHQTSKVTCHRTFRMTSSSSPFHHQIRTCIVRFCDHIGVIHMSPDVNGPIHMSFAYHGHHHINHAIILLKSVGISKLQVAILARSSREMSQTVRID